MGTCEVLACLNCTLKGVITMSITGKKGKWAIAVGSTVTTFTFVSGKTVELDLVTLYPGFLSLSPQQQYAIRYGVQQFSNDKTARKSDESLTDTEKSALITKKYNALCNGELRTERVTLTAEERAAAKALAQENAEKIARIEQIIATTEDPLLKAALEQALIGVRA